MNDGGKVVFPADHLSVGIKCMQRQGLYCRVYSMLPGVTTVLPRVTTLLPRATTVPVPYIVYIYMTFIFSY